MQNEWMEGITPVIAATISFGMGVDKATVRYISSELLPCIKSEFLAISLIYAFRVSAFHRPSLVYCVGPIRFAKSHGTGPEKDRVDIAMGQSEKR